MFSLIESREEIAKAQQKLEAAIRRDFKKEATKDIGYPGGTIFDAKVVTDGNYWYYSSDHSGQDVPNPRRFNWFGLFKKDAKLQITVEVNTAYQGRTGQVAGFFARDNNTDAVYLMHSGRVAGGTTGVGKDAFLAWSGQRLVEVVDLSGGIRNGILVMPVEGKGASRSAVWYIDAVAEFKQAVRDGKIGAEEFKRKLKEFEDFYSEARGRRKGRRSEKIDYISRHGDIIDALHSWRLKNPLPKGGKIVKNVLIDMGVAVGCDLCEVFEVKTSIERSNIYGAIGQLMVHGTAQNCRRVIVLPENELEPIADDLCDALKRLHIELLRFKLDEKKATII